jgi:hypothetical protein
MKSTTNEYMFSKCHPLFLGGEIKQPEQSTHPKPPLFLMAAVIPL